MVGVDTQNKARLFFLISDIYEKNLNFDSAKDYFCKGKRILFSNIEGIEDNYALILDRVLKD